MASVVLDGVSKVYPHGVKAVANLSLEVLDREFLVLVGPSGCGKSTVLRLIAGLEEITEGEISIGGRRVNGVSPKDRDVAMVFQNYALYPHMTAYENMAFGLKLRYGGSWLARALNRVFRPAAAKQLAEMRKQIPQRVQDTAKTLGIVGLLDRLPRQLSGGERQRVALGRAMVRNPAAFLFDEPLSNLDAKLRVDMRRELRQLHRQLQATMVFVTHDQVEAMTLGDRIAVMRAGRIQQIGSPMEVYRNPRNVFVAGFLGSPAMNLIEGEVREQGGQVQFTTPHGTLDVPARIQQRRELVSVTVLIRPEHLTLSRQQDAAFVWQGKVQSTEALGDANLIRVELNAAEPNEATLVCKVEVGQEWQPGERVSVCFTADRVHWFAGPAGERL